MRRRERNLQGIPSKTCAAAILFAVSVLPPTRAPAQCTSGGTSVVLPPSTIHLRSYHDPVHMPGRLAADTLGNLFVADPRKGAVFVRDRYGRLICSVGGMGSPLSLAVDDSRTYVGDKKTGSVLVFDRSWRLIRKLGQGDGEFLNPGDIAVDPDADYHRVYVVDSSSHTVKVYDFEDGGFLFSFGGQGRNAGQLDFPTAISIGEAGDVFVADRNNDRVQIFDREGYFQSCFTQTADSSFWCRYLGCTGFGRLLGLSRDSQARLYVADAFHSEIQVFDAGGVFLKTVAGYGQAAGQLRTPVGLAIDRYNRLFVASVNTGKIEVYGLDNFADPQLLPAVVDVEPDTCRRSSNKQYLTAYIEVPGHALAQVKPETITGNGVPAEPSLVAIGDFDSDGVEDLMVKFDASAVLNTLPDGEATIIVTGEFQDENAFEGSDAVRVLAEPRTDTGK